MLCILAVNVMFPKIVAPVVTVNSRIDERKLNAFVYVSFSRAHAYTLYSATSVLTI